MGAAIALGGVAATTDPVGSRGTVSLGTASCAGPRGAARVTALGIFGSEDGRGSPPARDHATAAIPPAKASPVAIANHRRPCVGITRLGTRAGALVSRTGVVADEDGHVRPPNASVAPTSEKDSSQIRRARDDTNGSSARPRSYIEENLAPG